LAVRLEGANHQWRKNPPGELSIDPEADEQFGRVTGWAGASWQRWGWAMSVEQRTLTSGVLSEDGEVTVIGNEPGNTDSDPDPSEKSVS
jgi:hypothetical protein